MSVVPPGERLARLLQAAGQELRLLEAVRQPVCISDMSEPGQPLVFVNTAFEQLTGYSAAEVLGQNCRFLQGPYRRQEAVASIRAGLAAGEPVDVVVRNVRRDGSEFDNELSLSPVRDGDGLVTHYVAVQRDQTERRAAQSARDQLREQGVRVASRLQRALLPERLPRTPGLKVVSRYEPGHLRGEPELTVSGDFYDVVTTPRGWMTVVGDVAGRGLEAAAFTGLARWGLRAHAEVDGAPDEVVAHLNTTLRGEMEERFLTLAAVDWERLPDAAGWRARIVLGGHPRPVLRRVGGEAAPVGAPGDLLGLFEQVDLPVVEVDLGPGDVLLLYTDGLLEAGGTADQFGEARLLLAASRPGGLDDVLDDLLAAVSEHNGSPVEDDLTLLAVEVLEDADAVDAADAVAGGPRPAPEDLPGEGLGLGGVAA